MTTPTPPHSLEAERVLLGQVLQQPEILAQERDRLRAEHFWRPDHANLWAFLIGMWDSNEPISLVTLPRRLGEADELFRQSKGRQGRSASRLGGVQYVLELPSYAPSTANHSIMAAEIVDLWRQREIMSAAEELTLKIPTGEDTGKLVAAAISRMTTVLGERRDRGVVRYGDERFHDAIDRGYARTDDRIENGDRVPGLSWGHPSLDLFTGGLRVGQLAVLAARPGQGKSLKALHAAHRWARAGEHVVLYTVEMTGEENVERGVVMAAGEQGLRGFPEDRGLAIQMRDGFDSVQVAQDVLEAGRAALKDLPVTIVPCGGMSIVDIRADFEARRAREGASVFIVDYIQLLASIDPRANRQVSVSASSNGAKQMTVDLGVKGMVLAQLSRAAEGVEPELSHLRESGSLEQDADQVLLLFRPETWYANPNEVPADLRGTAITKIAKARGGVKGRVQQDFLGDVLSFRNRDR